MQSNNSFVFSYKNKTDSDEPEWDTITLPTGSCQIDEINDEIQRRIKRITGKESKIAISAHVPTLSATVEISTPGYAVDIYNSSIRTVLGWPAEKHKAKPRPPEPKKSDYTSEGLKSIDYEEVVKDPRLYFPMAATNMIIDYSGIGYVIDGTSHWRYYRPTDEEYTYQYYPMETLAGVLGYYNDLYREWLKTLRGHFQLHLSDIITSDITASRDTIIKEIQKLNQFTRDIEEMNNRAVYVVVSRFNEVKQGILDILDDKRVNPDNSLSAEEVKKEIIENILSDWNLIL